MTYKQKLDAIRKLMAENNIQAYVIPSSDSHTSEYVPEHYKVLAFASGFTGSAGTLVITEDFAGLWADFRYFVQAEEQLKDSGYELVKLKVQHTPEYIGWLYERLPENAAVAFDYSLLSAEMATLLTEELSYRPVTVRNFDFISPIWANRPALPEEKAFLLKTADCGQSVTEKLNALRLQMQQQRCDTHIISSLDDIAWLFNIRGGDVNYNPVVLAYALVQPDKCTLFIESNKLDTAEIETLRGHGVEVAPYNAIYKEVNALPASSSVLVDEKRSSYKILKSIPNTSRVIKGTNPSTLLKAIKNATEISYTRAAMVQDGVALTRFFKWLEETLGNEPVTELSASAKAKYFREQGENFAGISFASISGYQQHAALPHYTPSAETNTELQQKGLYLLDSGGQYHYGTTDITRTVSVGENTDEEKRDFTLVLSALIAGSSANFPKGTRGYQIDAICRQPMWQNHINYGHGTGHGVGYYLNVHEGPQNIGPAAAPFPVESGMITSIEPGIYRPGKHGIRLENLVLTIEDKASEFGDFLKFETITLCYIDTTLVLKEVLGEEKLQWLNQYHETVYNEFSPYLTAEEADWLQQKCKSI